MSRLLETIKILDGEICNIAYHNRRFNESRKALFDVDDILDLRDHIDFPMDYSNGVYKCRVLYSEEVEQVEFHEYHLKPIRSIKLVSNDTIDYTYKYEDRSELNSMYELRGEADDILIVRQGLVTDSFYCNVAFKTGQAQWITPSDPLFAGTKRQRLIDEDQLSIGDIRLENLSDYSHIRLFNSMIEFGEIELAIDAIKAKPALSF